MEYPKRRPPPNLETSETTLRSFPVHETVKEDYTLEDPDREPWQIVFRKKTSGRLMLDQMREEAMLVNDPDRDKYAKIVNLKKKLDVLRMDTPESPSNLQPPPPLKFHRLHPVHYKPKTLFTSNTSEATQINPP